MTKSIVKHWTSTSPGDVNHKNKHAKVNGISFFAFPYQPYITDLENGYNCHVSKSYYDKESKTGEMFYVNIYKAIGGGRTEVVFHEGMETLDDAFVLASLILKQFRGTSNELTPK